MKAATKLTPERVAHLPQLQFGGHVFQIVDRTALFWPKHRALIVADLHLEKASWLAARGQKLPPHDSMATLERIAGVAKYVGAQKIFSLGDNFHDADGPHRLTSLARECLNQLTTQCAWHWITGNHDETLPPGLDGSIAEELLIDGILLRHRADPADPHPEMSGHFHPKYRARSERGGVTRPCFVRTPTKLILPAFGALTGGLYADHEEIRAACGAQAEALIATDKQLARFPL